MFGINNTMNLEIKRKPREPTLSMEMDEEGSITSFMMMNSRSMPTFNHSKASSCGRNSTKHTSQRLFIPLAHQPNTTPNDLEEDLNDDEAFFSYSEYSEANMLEECHRDWKPMTASSCSLEEKDKDFELDHHSFFTPHIPMKHQWSVQEQAFLMMIEEGSCSSNRENQLMEMAQRIDFNAHHQL
ncbi:hypothetical protein FDP41_011211 [Naegleria fowleri]|uniref:Uncharacterized protein n=1 Tax=Naegleria fowleri TaxID=5763 RepID=A0A6A5C5A4_NAEFO|nr:uncharacterized protein FDP41_011211 [Naegleria fowleri]KAF0982281.1 hypothetical protein FDP41_011211 [Naegleria fowleri]CAG4716063.1 unnamed protein product [Naegleria fowleri]